MSAFKKNGGYEAEYAACDCFWGSEPGSYVRKLAELVQDFSGLRILDVGCGEGKNAAFLAKLGSEVTALEISERALVHAKSVHAHAGIRWICADARNETWPDQIFDELSPNLGDERGSGGSGLSLRSDDLDSVVELYTEDNFRQLVVTAEAIPTFLGGLCELEDHGEGGLV